MAEDIHGAIEKHAPTVEEATEAALRELGLRRDEVTVEVVSAGRRGLFGTGRRAHVRVTPRVTPSLAEEDAAQPQRTPDRQEDGVVSDIETTVKQNNDRGGELAQPEEELSAEERLDLLDEEAEIAADFIEGLLDLLDLPGDIEIEVDEDQALVNVSDVGSGLLIGRRGATLDALQELVRSATQRQTERRSHVRVDVEGYRARQLDKLRDKCREAIAQVRETGEPVRLEPMDSYERKMMHDLVARTGGVTSVSEGSEPKRRVVIHPADE